MKKSIKEMSWVIKNDLKENGVDVPITKILESFSKAVGFNNYNTARTKEEEVQNTIKQLSPDYPLGGKKVNVESDGANHYDVTLQTSAILSMELSINAGSMTEAKDKAIKYVEDNGGFCGDSGDSWSFENTGGSSNKAVVTDVFRNLGSEKVEHVQVEPNWYLNDSLQNGSEIEGSFSNQVREFNGVEAKSHELLVKAVTTELMKKKELSKANNFETPASYYEDVLEAVPYLTDPELISFLTELGEDNDKLQELIYKEKNLEDLSTTSDSLSGNLED